MLELVSEKMITQCTTLVLIAHLLTLTHGIITTLETSPKTLSKDLKDITQNRQDVGKYLLVHDRTQ